MPRRDRIGTMSSVRREIKAWSSEIPRVVSFLRRHGVGGAAQRLTEEVGHALGNREAHVWYVRDLAIPQEAQVWPPGVSLVAGGEEHLHLLEMLDTVNTQEAQRRLAEGTHWWLVLEGVRPLFSCWIFHGSAPVLAAPKGQLVLPEDTVVLEDSVTTAAARGRGIAPTAWNAIASRLHVEGSTGMVTKVAVQNWPSRRAVVKAGFAEFALVRHIRIGPWSRNTVLPLNPASTWLLDSLGT